MPTRASAVVLVFARAPALGEGKSRLGLAPQDAARLQQRLIRRALLAAREARCGPVELHTTRAHRFLSTLRVPVRLQRGVDLGERMARALAGAGRRHRRAILIGADCAGLTSTAIAQAARLLCGAADVVIAPAEDGGYGLIGARRALPPALFRGMAWGASSVYAQTLQRLAAAGFRWRALTTVWDIDRPEDLPRLAALGFGAAARRRQAEQS